MKNVNTWIAAGLGAIALIAVASALPTLDRDIAGKQRDEPKPEVKATVGKAAPDFELKDLDGKVVKLSDYKGKTVVLEWFNPECPFVVRAHGEGQLKDQASRVSKEGIIWLSINSGAAGKQGNGVEKNRKAATTWKMTNPILLDEKGEVGRRYEAKTTPQMYIIDPKGLLVYRGAIDNAPNGKPEDDQKLVNYVDAALADIKAGKPVATAETKSYGCSVKY